MRGISSQTCLAGGNRRPGLLWPRPGTALRRRGDDLCCPIRTKETPPGTGRRHHQGGTLMTSTTAHDSLSAADHSRELRKAVIAATVGTTIEWYDFFLYGTA